MMKNVLAILIALCLAMVFSACQPKRQVPPNYEQVRQNSEEAQQDLRKEENKQQDKEE